MAAAGIFILTVGGVVYLQQLSSADDLSQATDPPAITTWNYSDRKTRKPVTLTSSTIQRGMNLQAKRKYEKVDGRMNRL